MTSDESPDLLKMLHDGYEFLSICEQRKVGKKSKGGEKRKQPLNTPPLPNSLKKVKQVGRKSLGTAGERN